MTRGLDTYLLAIVLLSFVSPVTCNAGNQDNNAKKQSTEQDAISSVLENQVAAWNRHDLQSFMRGYWKSPELTFVSGAKVTRGWQPTLERYRSAYQAEGHEMGTLEFSDLNIRTLGPEAAFARGEFWLTMSDGKQPHGVFTLIFRKFPEGWRIIHDHTCAAP